MFKIGDIVEIAEESDFTGMLDFKKGKAYEVEGVSDTGHTVRVTDESGRTDWYHCTHFKLKEKEKIVETNLVFKVGDTLICTETDRVDLSMHSLTTGKEYVVKGVWDNHKGVTVVGDDGEEVGVYGFRFKLKEGAVEKKECLFKKGQVVWDVVYGKGVVVEIADYSSYPVIAHFSDETMTYTVDGKTYETHGRTLFFSEPKIEAATKPVFEPMLKEGDVVIISCFRDRKDSSKFRLGVVEDETEDFVYTQGSDAWEKDARDFYRLGEKINFK